MKAAYVMASFSAAIAVAYLVWAFYTKCQQWQRYRATPVVYDGLTFASYLCLLFYSMVWFVSHLPKI